MDTSKYKQTEGFKQGLQARRDVLGDGYVSPSIAQGADDPFTSEYLRHLRQDIGQATDEAMGWPMAYRKVLAAVFLAQGQRLLGDE